MPSSGGDNPLMKPGGGNVGNLGGAPSGMGDVNFPTGGPNLGLKQGPIAGRGGPVGLQNGPGGGGGPNSMGGPGGPMHPNQQQQSYLVNHQMTNSMSGEKACDLVSVFSFLQYSYTGTNNIGVNLTKHLPCLFYFMELFLL